jgi:hypothetical protein
VRYPDAWTIGEQAGFRAGSNAGWTGAYNGFRSGTCWPYRAFDMVHNKPFSFIEVPLVYMDTTPDKAQQIPRQVLDLAREVCSMHGLLTVNFHSDIWDEFGLYYRGQAYTNILRDLYQNDWYFIQEEDIFKIFDRQSDIVGERIG